MICTLKPLPLLRKYRASVQVKDWH
uniref:Uncharacterized protein n=1 Tax=Rhizophora mucronata TaxID=61149 RepID=A0A2P2P0G3_RHIMU